MKDERTKVNGLDLHYVDRGSGDATPLVLLHGLTSHCRSWDALAGAVSDGRRVVALDQRGHGDSQWASSYTTADYVADALALADHLGLQRFALGGLSMGAHNSIAFAAAHPGRVERLIVIDIPPAMRRPGAASAPAAQRAQMPAPQRVFDSVDDAFKQARAQNPRPPEDVHRARVEHGLKRTDDGRFELKYDPDAPRLWAPADLWDALAAISCPVLILRGAETMVLPRDTAEKMAATFPDARLVDVEGAGHSVPLDRPDTVEREVRAFLGAQT